MELVQINNEKSWTEMIKDAVPKLKLVYFYADWAPQCGQMADVLQELVNDKEYQDVKIYKVLAENFVDVSQKHNITSVPAFIFLKSEDVVDRLDGANVPELMKKIKLQLSKVFYSTANPDLAKKDTKIDLNLRLQKLINTDKCMLFMKGAKEQPKCGFSKQVIELLEAHNAEYKTFDILGDEEVRQGLKEYSKWPTYPQLYVNGELVGGLDILKELSEDGELKKMLPQKKPDLNTRLKQLINRSPVIIFMKGSPETPRCGFSKTLVGIFNEIGTKYDTFDILEDEEVRQGLKTYSNWPTYPQVYVKGNLIGGLDIIKELLENGELKTALEG